MKPFQCRGFTLIELSIVLIIIGLMVGGILVSKDMIRAADIRASIADIQQVETAVSTFKTTYESLPGDMDSSKATALGFSARAGGFGKGNGDRFVSGTSMTNAASGESLLFWRDLAEAKLIKDTSLIIATDGDAALGSVDGYLPKTGPSNKARMVMWSARVTVMMSNYDYYNYLTLAGLNDFSVAGQYNVSTAFTPFDAASIDTKIDNGDGTNGDVTGSATLAPPITFLLGPVGCVWSGGYNLTSDDSNSALCNVVKKMQFKD